MRNSPYIFFYFRSGSFYLKNTAWPEDQLSAKRAGVSSRFFSIFGRWIPTSFDNNLPDRLKHSREGFFHYVILRARYLDLYLLHLSRSVLHWKHRNNLSQNNAGQRAIFPFTYVLLLSLMHLIHISLFISKLMITVKNPLITQPSTRKKGVNYSIHPTILVIIYFFFLKDPRNTKKCSILHVHVCLFPNSLLSVP